MSDAPTLRWSSGTASHQGKIRDHNEDSWFSADEQGLWAVADGMGGHQGGEWASAIVVEQLGSLSFAGDFDACCEEIANALHRSNRAIYEEAMTRRAQMGTTAVVLFVRDRKFAVIWVGDSRAYLLRSGTLHQLSTDHTQVQEMLDRGMLGADEALSHPMRHVLARAIGVQSEVDVDVVCDVMEPGDTFLLSSDGLHCCVQGQDIQNLLSRSSLEDVAKDLVAQALDRGAPDNVTVIAVRFREATQLTSSPAGAAQ